MNSSAFALPEPPRGRPIGGGGVHRHGGLGALAPINVFTGIQVYPLRLTKSQKKSISGRDAR